MIVTAIVVLIVAPALAGATAYEQLTKPGKLSRWALVTRKAVVRVHPASDARAITRLRMETEDCTDELVLALERYTDASGRRWVRVRLPVLPNNTTGWVPQDALGGFHRITTWLRINTRRLRAILIRSGRPVFSARMGIGKSKWPTPHGVF